MAKFSFKAGKSFLLNYKEEYLGVLTEIEEFDNPKNKTQGGFKFHFDIMNNIPLEEGGDDGETSRGKSLKVSYWANGKDDDGNWTFPETGKYRNLLESLADFLEVSLDDVDDADDLLGGVVRFYITNDRSEKDKDKMYSNIDSDSVKSIKRDKIESIQEYLEKYLKWKSKNVESSKSKPKSKSKEEVKKDVQKKSKKSEEVDDEFEDDKEEEEKPKSKSKPKSEEVDDEFEDDKEEEEKPKSKSKKSKSDDDDDFFD
jgi:hypothetical protein